MYGFIPVMPVSDGTSQEHTEKDLAILSRDNMQLFLNQVDIKAVIRDMWTWQSFAASALCEVLPGCRSFAAGSFISDSVPMEISHLSVSTESSNSRKRVIPTDPMIGIGSRDGKIGGASKKRKIHSRDEIQTFAQQSGAKGG